MSDDLSFHITGSKAQGSPDMAAANAGHLVVSSNLSTFYSLQKCRPAYNVHQSRRKEWRVSAISNPAPRQTSPFEEATRRAVLGLVAASILGLNSAAKAEITEEQKIARRATWPSPMSRDRDRIAAGLRVKELWSPIEDLKAASKEMDGNSVSPDAVLFGKHRKFLEEISTVKLPENLASYIVIGAALGGFGTATLARKPMPKVKKALPIDSLSTRPELLPEKVNGSP